MPLFVCANCNVVENTATAEGGFYDLTRKREGNPPICSECKTGTWHGKFDRIDWADYPNPDGVSFTPENEWRRA